MSLSVDGLHLLADEEGFSSEWIYQEINVSSAFLKQKAKLKMLKPFAFPQ